MGVAHTVGHCSSWNFLKNYDQSSNGFSCIFYINSYLNITYVCSSNFLAHCLFSQHDFFFLFSELSDQGRGSKEFCQNCPHELGFQRAPFQKNYWWIHRKSSHWGQSGLPGKKNTSLYSNLSAWMNTWTEPDALFEIRLVVQKQSCSNNFECI